MVSSTSKRVMMRNITKKSYLKDHFPRTNDDTKTKKRDLCSIVLQKQSYSQNSKSNKHLFVTCERRKCNTCENRVFNKRESYLL